MEKEIKLNLTTDQKEVVIYTGDAPEKFTYEKSPLKIEGTIAAVVNYFEKRWEGLTPDEKASTMVKYNKADHTLTLVIDEKHEKQDAITGKMVINQHFKEFGINTEKLFGVAEFAKFLKLKRSFFPDRKAYSELIDQLKNFKASSTGAIETANNDKGDKKLHLDNTLKAALPDSFVLQCEIVKGESVSKMLVELCRDMMGAEVKIWLVSNDVVDIIEKTTDEVFEKALKVFQAKDIPCFEQ